MTRLLAVFATITVLVCPPVGLAQASAGDSVTPAGVVRAARVVDSVFIDRLADEGWVAAGDWASYLMARLGVIPIPRDLRIVVTSDTGGMIIASRLGELPYEARRALGPLLGVLPPQTVVAGRITLHRAAREVVRFHLAAVLVNGLALPDLLVASAMLDVGRQYPALSRTGRDLFVQVPLDAEVKLEPGGVRLLAPPDTARPLR